MKRLLALLAAGLGLRALLKRRARRTPAATPADDLRAKLAAAKAEEQAAQEAQEEAPQPEQTVEGRRADVHANARRTIEDLRDAS